MFWVKKSIMWHDLVPLKRALFGVHVIRMLLPCDVHVISMLYTCDVHNDINAMYTMCPCDIHLWGVHQYSVQ